MYLQNNNNNNNNNNNVTYFDSLGVEHSPKEIKTFIGRSFSIKTNVFRIQAYDSMICGYFSIGFIGFILAGKKLTDYTNLFSPNDFKKNDNIIFAYLKMNESNSLEAIDKTSLYEQTKFRLSEIIGI